MGMKNALLVLNKLAAEGVINDYAIGGAMGAMYYIEAVTTIDLDVFVVLPDENRIDVLSPLYARLRELGYAPDALYGECINVEGVPIQFLMAYSPLLKEAMQHTRTFDYKGIDAKVIDAPYLAAICAQTNRAKDQLRLLMFLSLVDFDKKGFYDILDRFGMSEVREKFENEDN